MIAVLENELIEKRKWLEKTDFLNVVAVAESTPGPLAINSATYLGYKRGGFFGSLFATLGVVLPSFIIIFTISLFFNQFLSLTYVKYAFKGIQVCVAFLIISAGIKMMKHLEKKFLNVSLFFLTTALLILLDLFAINFSSIFFILIGGAIGLIIYFVSIIRNKEKANKNKQERGEK